MARNGRESVFQIEIINFRKRNNGHYAPRMTLIRRGISAERVKERVAKLGTIISCRKVGMSDDRSVSISPYFRNIESLNLRQEPITIEIDREEYVVNKALELSRPRKRYSDKLFDTDPLDNEKQV